MDLNVETGERVYGHWSMREMPWELTRKWRDFYSTPNSLLYSFLNDPVNRDMFLFEDDDQFDPFW